MRLDFKKHYPSPMIYAVSMLALFTGMLSLSGCQTSEASLPKALSETHAPYSPPSTGGGMVYIQHMYHKGQPLRWKQHHLNLYCETPSLCAMATQMLQPWQAALLETYPIAFNTTPNEASAHIRLYATPSLEGRVQFDEKNRRATPLPLHGRWSTTPPPAR